jgi:phenylalanyl-tRNA synthetase beta chain
MTSDRSAMRRSLLSAVLDTLERNVRLRERLALFELGPVFLPKGEGQLPDEPRRLAIVMSGQRQAPAWDQSSKQQMDFYDLKGVVEAMLEALHVNGAKFEPVENPSFHPGKTAQLTVGETVIGVLGELHPLVKENYDFLNPVVLAADFDLEALSTVIPWSYISRAVPEYPPVLEDLAVIVEEAVPAAKVEEAIRQGGGKLLTKVRLFDVFRGAQIGEGKKSLAYALAYQNPEKTLTDTDAAQIRQRIVKRLEQELGAKLRS